MVFPSLSDTKQSIWSFEVQSSGPGGRRFKSSLPDHSFSFTINDLRSLRGFPIFVSFRYRRSNGRRSRAIPRFSARTLGGQKADT